MSGIRLVTGSTICARVVGLWTVWCQKVNLHESSHGLQQCCCVMSVSRLNCTMTAAFHSYFVCMVRHFASEP